VGVGGGGAGPQTPNPKSPIPNNYYKIKYYYFTKLILFYYKSVY